MTVLGRDLQLMDICPNWMMALRSGRSKMNLASDKDRYCMVGEAWGFSNRYNHKCGECYRYCLELTWVVSGSTRERKRFHISDMNEYRLLSKEFIKHFNEAHKAEWFNRQTN